MNIELVTFHNQEIPVLSYEGKPYVAMKPICENIGLSWKGQHERIRRNEALNQGIRMIRTPSNGGYQEVTCLPLGYLNGWLFGIEINRCKPEIRDILRLYQLECFDVLYKHFLPSIAEEQPNTITVAQQYEIQTAISERATETGEHWSGLYTKLHHEFKIPRYQELKAVDFDRAIAFIKSGKSSKDSRRWFVEVRVTDNLFKGTATFSGVAHDTNCIVTCIAQNFGFQIHSMSKVGDALESVGGNHGR